MPLRRFFFLSLLFLSTPAFASCPLPGESAVVPDGYRYPSSNKWQECVTGKWTDRGPVLKSRPYTNDNTGSCLPLDKQFVKKNGMISMNFVPEKTEKKFYGKRHECIAGNWWRLEEGKAPSTSKGAESGDTPDPGNKKIQSIADQLGKLQTDTGSKAESPMVATPPVAPSASSTPAPAPTAPAEKPLSFEATQKPQKKPTAVEPGAPQKVRPSKDYEICRTHCMEGMNKRLEKSRTSCREKIVKQYGDGEWPKEWVNTFNQCRAVAARQEKVNAMKCLRPCKKQAGHYIWEGN